MLSVFLFDSWRGSARCLARTDATYARATNTEIVSFFKGELQSMFVFIYGRTLIRNSEFAHGELQYVRIHIRSYSNTQLSQSSRTRAVADHKPLHAWSYTWPED